MKKVKFFSSYCSEEQIEKNIISSWGMGSRVYKDLYITAENDYEYAVVLNVGKCDKDLDPKRVIGFSHEPRKTLGLTPEYVEYVRNKVSEYYLSNNTDLPDNFKSGFSFVCPADFGKSKTLEYTHEKKMSMILSMSNFMPGHGMRHQLLKRILETEMDIHFYANGLNLIYKDERVKEFDWNIFNIPYDEYKFQIVIENIIDESWSTEKLTNCIIKETIPIYYGSKKSIDMFYPEKSITLLGENVEKNMEIIRECYYTSKYNTEITKHAKDKLYSQNNLLEFLYQKFKNE